MGRIKQFLACSWTLIIKTKAD